MKKFDRITPEGTRDLLFKECAAQRKIINVLRDTFESKAYHEVITPGFEFYDVFFFQFHVLSSGKHLQDDRP